MEMRDTRRVVGYGLLGATILTSFLLPGRLTVPTMLAMSVTPPSQITMRGLVRDFQDAHVDFGVVPIHGNGHYAGNVARLLGDDGRPGQVHGVTDFSVSLGRLIPGMPFSARATVLGAAITSGSDPLPVTCRVVTDAQVLEPFGTYDYSIDDSGDVNDGANPRHHVFTMNQVYTASTPIAISASSWKESSTTAQFGNTAILPLSGSLASHKSVATKVTLPQDGTVTSITAYIDDGGDMGSLSGKDVCYAMYADNAGEPGALIAESVDGETSAGWNWHTLSVTPTWIAAGEYWLALSQHNDGEQLRYGSAGGQTRIMDKNNHSGGYDDPWGVNETSNSYSVSIYANYSPDELTWGPHMSVLSEDDSPYVKVLKDGDTIPPIPGLNDQASILEFVDDYIDVDAGVMTLSDNQAIYLFELGTTNLGSSAADFQDLVVLVTLATDPMYFASPDVTSEEYDPVGYKVDAEWTDSSGNPIAPHLFDSSRGDVAGTQGVTSSGGVTSPATFDSWYRDLLGVNQSGVHDITLTDDGTGVYTYSTDDFHPVDGMMYGNQGGSHNSNFTYSFNAEFTYDSSGSQFLEFRGGDGAFAYINGQLVMDLGGVRTNTTQSIDLDRLGLSDGDTYEMFFFYANRDATTGDFHMRTNVPFGGSRVIGTVTSAFD